MAKYVVTADVALRLARDRAQLRSDVELLAPALIRSQLVSVLYRAAGRGEVTKREAKDQLDFVRGLRMRLLGDRVLQSVAWDVAGELGWPDTYDAEYVALARLHGDALVTLDERLAREVRQLVRVEDISALF